MLKECPLRAIYLDLEHRVLHSLTIIAAGLGQAAQALATCSILSAHVIADQNHHVATSLPQKWRISLQIAAQMASEQLRLNVREQTKWCLLAEETMLYFLTLALLISSQ